MQYVLPYLKAGVWISDEDIQGPLNTIKYGKLDITLRISHSFKKRREEPVSEPVPPY